MNPVVKVALHPVFLLGAVTSFLSVALPQYFHLPPLVPWLLSFAVSALTLVVAQQKAVHQDLAIPVSPGVFHMVITSCTIAGTVFQFLNAWLSTSTITTSALGYDGTGPGTVVPFTVPVYVYGILAIGKGLADVLANQLHLEEDGADEEIPQPAQIAPVEPQPMPPISMPITPQPDSLIPASSSAPVVIHASTP